MEALVASISLITLSLLAGIGLPSRVANSHARTMRQLVTALLAVQFVLAAIAAIDYIATGSTPQVIALASWAIDFGVGFSVYYDGASGLMLLLVSGIGFIVSRFSIRYLDAEATQGRYFRWLGITVGAVSLLVAAGNLLQFVFAWVLTSYGLHHLLLHYGHREAAQRAAWSKFAISRLGDAFLAVALVLVLQTFGTFDFKQLFAQANELAASGQTTPQHLVIAWLLMLGAVTKSAQFPFHAWLPETMETPTPVSALMHAGIVNAGGFLIIRMSPIVTLAPEALTTLALIGAFTACFAGVVMMAQSSIKRTLAYSTIAQMGFMMLQCGLGAFSAAMLHILAHSLYKAHAFLGSGSVVNQATAMRGARKVNPSLGQNLICLLAAALASTASYLTISTAFGIDLFAKPGGPILAMILCLALTMWAWRIFLLGDRKASLGGIVGISLLSLGYVVSYFAIDQLLRASLPAKPLMNFTPQLAFGIAGGFTLLFALQQIQKRYELSHWMAALRVHAANGFYVDALYRRVFPSQVSR